MTCLVNANDEGMSVFLRDWKWMVDFIFRALYFLQNVPPDELFPKQP
jgi:hypothetical protein